MRRDFFPRLILCLFLFAVSFGVTFGILCLTDRDDPKQPEAQVEELLTQPMAPETQTTEPQTAETQTTETPTTETQTAVLPETTPEPEPQGHSVEPPYHEQAAPDDYFEDALFLGNSLFEGLGIYSLVYDENIAKATFDTATSMTIFGAGDYISDAANGGYGKIYIGLGLNEIGYDHEAIREENKKAIDTIRAGNPDAIIYLFSLTPISKYRSENDSLYNNTNAAAISQVLREVAEEKECYFIDLVPVLAGDDGYLPSDVTSDGVHCVKEYYPRWYEYLEHNYVLP